MKLKITQNIKLNLSFGRCILKEGEERDFNERDSLRLLREGLAEECKPKKKKKVVEPEVKGGE